MRRKLDIFILLLVLLIGFFAVRNAVAIGDWWHARVSEPSSEAVRLAQNAKMSETGKKLFFRFDPQVVSQAELDEKCTANKLGCAEGQSIYILHYDDDKDYNQAVVTAAHEMLHVAWSRLSDDEIKNVTTLLEKELQRADATTIRDKLDGYNDADYVNEAHSFVGTELAGLSAELEEHYRNYFDEREAVVRAYGASK